MMFEQAPQQFCFNWCFRAEKVEDRPLCRVMWGKDTSDEAHEVLCYEFDSEQTLKKAQRVVCDLAKFPWFESFKALHQNQQGDGGILSVNRAVGPCLQEVLGLSDCEEQARLCLELARAIEVLHRHNMTHGMLDGSNVMYDPVKKVPVICQTVCGFFLHQIFPAAVPPDRRGVEAFAASESDDVWQFGALFLKRLTLRDPRLAKVIFKCTHPNPQRRPKISWVVEQLMRYSGKLARPKPAYWIWSIRFGGGLLLMLAIWSFVSATTHSPSPIPRQIIEKGGITLVREPVLSGIRLTLGDTIKDLEVVLGKHIVVEDGLQKRAMPEGSWLVWDQLLEQMGLGWRVGPEGTIEIFEEKTAPPTATN